MAVFSKAACFEEHCQPFAIVTIIATDGRVSRKSGRMFVDKDGRREGTIGGGTVESLAIKEAQSAIKEGKGRKALIDNGGKGHVEVYIDVPCDGRSVIIIGRGNVAAEVEKLFKAVGWYVETFERGTSFDALPVARITEKTAVVISGAADKDLAEPMLSTPAFYIGVLASRSVSLPSDKRIYAPAGLEIGAETPEEIALSIVSEVMAVYKGKNVQPLSAWNENLILVRGAGDLATGSIVRLHNAGYKVIATEVEKPTVIRRTVSFAEAVYDKEMIIEGVKGVLVNSPENALRVLDDGAIPIIIDPELTILSTIKPRIVIDATIAKRNLGTRIDMADLVIALGPGFTAGVDADVVIETKRGHFLGTVIREGSAIPNTGIPGNIGGYAEERVIHSPAYGVFKGKRNIGDIVKKGDLIAEVGGTPVYATIDGKLRGLLHDGLIVSEGFKIADIDPRGESADHTTISDKARAIGGGVLEAVDSFLRG